MRFGVMSDTHGNLRFASEAADRIVAAGATFIYHLGDDYTDAELLRFSGLDVRMVPGLWCREYRDPNIPNIIEDNIEGVPLACAHTIEALRKHRTAAKVLFFGHTHTAQATLVGEVLHVNPGHLKSSVDRGEAASFALVDLDATRIQVLICKLNGSLRARRAFQRSALGC